MGGGLFFVMDVIYRLPSLSSMFKNTYINNNNNNSFSIEQ